ncbi:hypothetical protein AAF712_014275 [Marasmius tenuissimus]|uniref:Uncharacterized protein n=1 Tax=Marasmius tenuissimus TaxID=585030 RepID=A0ABR2ZBP8_9AGAR
MATTPIVTDEHIDGGDDDSDSEDEVHSAVAMGKPIKLKVGGARKEKLFSEIVGRKSSDVAIGPLEILSVAVCLGDPTLPEYVLSCEAKCQVRQKNKKAIALLGTAKRAMSNALRKKSNTAVTKVLQRSSFTICSIIINPPLTYNFTIVFAIYLNVLRDSTTVTTMGMEVATQ